MLLAPKKQMKVRTSRLRNRLLLNIAEKPIAVASHGGSDLVARMRAEPVRHRQKTRISPRKDTALIQKMVAIVAAWAMKPAKAGPTARAKLKLMRFSAAALWICPGSTSVETAACQAGIVSAAPQPITSVPTNSISGVTKPAVI